MLTSCSHSFCTLCIRRYLAQEGRCPTCRAGEQETKLRRNNALEELVDAFRGVRGRVLDVAKGWKGVEEGNGDEDDGSRKGRGRTRREKRKVEEAGLDDDGGAGLGSESGEKDVREQTRPRARKRTRSQRARARARGKDESASQENDSYVSDADMQMDETRDTAGSRNVEENSIDEWHNAEQSLKDKDARSAQQMSPGLVSCPVCNRRMKVEAVEPHLDKCIADTSNPTKPTQPSTPSLSLSSSHIPSPSQNHQSRHRQLPSRSSNPLLSTSFPSKASIKQVPPPQPQSRLAQLNHSLLRDRQLRQKLSELGIPDWGPRALLIRRHTEWVNLHNANCDALRPRSKRELLKDLDVWERTLGGLAPAVTGTAAGNVSGGGGGGGGDESTTLIDGKGSAAAAVMRKDFDGKGWARKNRNEFDELIAVARQSRESKVAAVADDVDGVNDAGNAGIADAETVAGAPNTTTVPFHPTSSTTPEAPTSTSATLPFPDQSTPTANDPIPITIDSDNEPSATEKQPLPTNLASTTITPATTATTAVDMTPVIKSDILQQPAHKDKPLEINGGLL